MGPIDTDDEFGGRPADAPDEFGGRPAAPESSFRAAPNAASFNAQRQPDDYSHPGVVASAIRGAAVGAGVTPIGHRITAAGNSAVGDQTYDQALAAEEARTRNAAVDHPVAYAAGRVPAALTAAMRGGIQNFAALTGLNAAIETPGGIPEKAGAALTGAAATYAMGRAPPIAQGVMAGGSAVHALDSNEPDGEKLAAVGDALVMPVAHMASTGSRRAAALDPEIAKAQEAHGAAEQRRSEDPNEPGSAAMVRDAQDMAQKESVAGAYDVATNVNKVLADQKKSRLADIRRANLVFSGDFKGRMKQYRDTVAAERARKQAENDEDRLSSLDFEDEFAKQSDAHEKAVAAWEQRVADARKVGGDAKMAAKAAIATKIEEQKLRNAWIRDGDRLRKRVEEEKAKITDPSASAEGEWGEMHKELFTRFVDYVNGAKALGQEPDDAVVKQLAYLFGRREALNPEKGKKLQTAIDLINELGQEKGHAKWIENRAAELAPEREAKAKAAQADLDAATAEPDFRKTAQENRAARQTKRTTLDPYDRAQINETVLKPYGIDPSGVTDQMLLEGDIGDLPERPGGPSRAAHQQAARDFARMKITNPRLRIQKPDRTAFDQNMAQHRIGAMDAKPTGVNKIAQDWGAEKVPRFDFADTTPQEDVRGRDLSSARAIRRGEQNVADTLASAKSHGEAVKPTVGAQYEAEKHPNIVGRAFRKIPWVGRLSKPPAQVLSGKFLSQTPAETSRPEEMLALLRAGRDAMERRSLARGTAQRMTAGAGAVGASDENRRIYRRWLEKHRSQP